MNISSAKIKYALCLEVMSMLKWKGGLKQSPHGTTFRSNSTVLIALGEVMRYCVQMLVLSFIFDQFDLFSQLLIWLACCLSTNSTDRRFELFVNSDSLKPRTQGMSWFASKMSI